MAKLSFSSIENQPVNTTENTSNNSGVKFFALKDGESAIVRILCNSVDDIEIYTVAVWSQNELRKRSSRSYRDVSPLRC